MPVAIELVQHWNVAGAAGILADTLEHESRGRKAQGKCMQQSARDAESKTKEESLLVQCSFFNADINKNSLLYVN